MYTTPRLGQWTAILRHEDVNSTFSGAHLAPFTVLDANVQRQIVPGLSAFVSVENVADAKYQVNLSGTLVSLGLPRTLRAGLEAFRH